jgi:hypothetical protein
MVRMARNWIVGLAMAAAATGASAYERMPAEEWTQPYAATLAKLPLCHDPRVLEKIQSRFASNEREYWNSLLTIVNFERVKPTDFRPGGSTSFQDDSAPARSGPPITTSEKSSIRLSRTPTWRAGPGASSGAFAGSIGRGLTRRIAGLRVHKAPSSGGRGA